MLKNHKRLLPYIAGHFIVDFACAFFMFRQVYNKEQWLLCLLLYNFSAFALQMPLGLLADRLNRNAICAAIGCGFVALSFFLGDSVIMATVLVGIGNGLFHIGGGIDVLNVSKEKPILLGIFVSPGALGLFLGTLCAKQGMLSSVLVVIAVLLTAACVLVVNYSKGKGFCSNNEAVSLQGGAASRLLFALGCFTLVVLLRSYIGLTSSFAWKSQWVWSWIYICTVVLGKAAGGFLAVKHGAVKASILSLGIAAVLFLFSDNPVLGVGAVFFFNMTMPITLWAVAKLLPGGKGFSFGLLTFGLFLGFLPVYLGVDSLLNTTIGFAAASLVSLFLLVMGLKKVVV